MSHNFFARFQADGVAGVLDYIGSFPAEERLALYGLAQRELSGRDSAVKQYDGYVAVVDAGIAEALARAEQESDPERAKALIDRANILSFNLLADLAGCWPEPGPLPERRHHEQGLRAAENCIRWRDELGKPDDRKAMAWWGKGIHLLWLDRVPEAIEAFRKTVALVMPGGGLPDSSSSFDQLLYSGYLAIGQSVGGDSDARARYDAIVEAFTVQLADNARREDAEFGIAQLEVVGGRSMHR